MEVSPGWGHWGVLNVDFSEKETGNIVNASTATPPEIIKAGHAANALVIVHNPYSDYGFLHLYLIHISAEEYEKFVEESEE